MTLGTLIKTSALYVLCAFACTVNGQTDSSGLTTELKVHNGRPVLFINSKPHDGLFCSVQSDYMQNFIDAGFDIFDTHPGAPHGWKGDNVYDYTETDAYIDAYLKQKPDARLILRFWFGYPRNFWWAKKYPEHRSVPHQRDKGRMMPSFASMKWRREAGEALRRVIAHCEEKYGNNIVAYVPGGGSCGEWFQWHTFTEDPDRFEKGYEMGDYSEPMRRSYRKFVRDKYVSIKRLNDVYNETYSSFDELAIPDVASRLNAQAGNLRSVKQEQAVIDYYEVLNREVAETLIYFAKMAKKGCSREKVIMVFFGYHWLEQPRGGVTLSRSGHVHLDEVLTSPDVDYVVGPYHYSFRQLEGVMSGQSLPASVLLRRKQYVQEIDCSTFLKPSWPCEDHHVPGNAKESGAILRRDLTKTLMEGASLWYMDLFRGMYDSPEMVQELKATLDAGRANYFKAGYNNRQVAVVLSSRDAFYYRENDPLRAALLPQFKQFQLERMGLGYDDIMLENLKYLDTEETAGYRFWIFPSFVHMTAEEETLIRKHAMRNNNYILWVYGPGAVSENGIDTDRMRDITGFDFGYTMEAGELAVRVEPGKHPIIAGRQSPIVFGTYGEPSPDEIRYHSSLRHYPGSDTGFSVTPRFFITASDRVLGRMPDIDGNPAGLCLKQMDDWVSVYSAAPMVPRHILRNIAGAAQCHVYTDFPGQTCQSKGYVGFFAHETGDCTIRFPYDCNVIDVFAGTEIARNVSEITLPVSINDAILLHFEPAEK